MHIRLGVHNDGDHMLLVLLLYRTVWPDNRMMVHMHERRGEKGERGMAEKGGIGRRRGRCSPQRNYLWPTIPSS